MKVMLKSLFLLLTTFAVLPAWHSCRGQDRAIAGTAPESSQQPQQDSPPKPAAVPLYTNPSSQQTPTPPTSKTSPSPTLDNTANAGKVDDNMHKPHRKML